MKGTKGQPQRRGLPVTREDSLELSGTVAPANVVERVFLFFK